MLPRMPAFPRLMRNRGTTNSLPPPPPPPCAALHSLNPKASRKLPLLFSDSAKGGNVSVSGDDNGKIYTTGNIDEPSSMSTTDENAITTTTVTEGGGATPPAGEPVNANGAGKAGAKSTYDVPINDGMANPDDEHPVAQLPHTKDSASPGRCGGGGGGGVGPTLNNLRTNDETRIRRGVDEEVASRVLNGKDSVDANAAGDYEGRGSGGISGDGKDVDEDGIDHGRSDEGKYRDGSSDSYADGATETNDWAWADAAERKGYAGVAVEPFVVPERVDGLCLMEVRYGSVRYGRLVMIAVFAII